VEDEPLIDTTARQPTDSPACPACGLVLRDGDDVISVNDRHFHVDCVAAPVAAARRRIGGWSAMGSRGQMAMGDTQRDPL
jgi:DNA-binding IclR family transcriptional regulator